MIRNSLAAVPQRGTFLLQQDRGGGRRSPSSSAWPPASSTFFARTGGARLAQGVDRRHGVLRAVLGGGALHDADGRVLDGCRGDAAQLHAVMGILMPFFFLVSNDPGRGVRREEGRPLPPRPGRRRWCGWCRGRDVPYGPGGRPRHHGAVGGRGGARRVRAAQSGTRRSRAGTRVGLGGVPGPCCPGRPGPGRPARLVAVRAGADQPVEVGPPFPAATRPGRGPAGAARNGRARSPRPPGRTSARRRPRCRARRSGRSAGRAASRRYEPDRSLPWILRNGSSATGASTGIHTVKGAPRSTASQLRSSAGSPCASRTFSHCL